MAGNEFDGTRILVTGAGKGIGRAVAIHLAGLGAEVIALSRAQSDLDSLTAEIGGQGIAVDLEDATAARQAAEAAGQVDHLVNCAGITELTPFLETTVEAFDRIMAVNVRAAMVVAQVVARRLVAAGKPGAIVNVGSVASTIGLPDHTSYCASKGAMDSLTMVMARELGPHGIRTNAVLPTVTLTPMAVKAWSDEAKAAAVKARIPLGRFVEPVEVAETIAFLLSPKAAMLNGVMLPVDGGFKIA